MFFRHLHHCEAFPGREREHGFGRGRHGGGRFGGGLGGREGRMFDTGELRLVILALIAEKPRHGYEVIKGLSERAGGDYSPSPGVVYPTLTLLEDTGLASASVDAGGRKLYAVTPEGQKALDDNRAQIDAIFARLKGDNEADWASAGSVIRAMLNLRATVKLRLRGRSATKEQIQAITDALDAAAKAIERI
jgi:DNA-binding PadR family transcriptional regulator